MKLFFNLGHYKLGVILLIGLLLRIGYWGVGDGTSTIGLSVLSTIREQIYASYLTVLPSPHSELVAGIVLGLDRLDLVPTFNDILLRTGTVHVVVVSGFNIVIFFSFLQRILGSLYRFSNLLIAEIVSLVYAVFTGFEYPVMRAWLMCTILYSAKYLGIRSSSMYILIITALGMLIIEPTALFDMSFQLSFLAVAGLMLFGNFFEDFSSQLFKRRANAFYIKDFLASLSAQVLVWPLISLKIGTVNVISPFTNALLLWSISYATAFGLILSLCYKSFLLSKVITVLLYPFLDFFIEGSYFLARVLPDQLQVRLALPLVVIYYFLVCLLVWKKNLLRV
jgi:competence protein ComEC